MRYGESGCTQRLVDAEDKLSGVKFEAVSGIPLFAQAS